MENYHTSISELATEQVIDTYADGQPRRAEYRRNGAVVGVRYFGETGGLAYECALHNGVPHGMSYRWDTSGLLIAAEPYLHGLPQGTAHQWADDGTLVGTYPMVHGTGIDLWWQACGYLSEVWYKHAGKLHGFEWWLAADQASVTEERHWWQGQLHGIERQWNRNGRLRRGYPKYWVHGEQVRKRQYLKACAQHPELPRFRAHENLPQREFPPEIVPHLRRTSRCIAGSVLDDLNGSSGDELGAAV